MSEQLPQTAERPDDEQGEDQPRDSDFRATPPLQQIATIFVGAIALALVFYAGGRLFNLGWMIAVAWAFAFGASVGVATEGVVAAWRAGR
jgi:hypothetical protein